MSKFSIINIKHKKKKKKHKKFTRYTALLIIMLLIFSRIATKLIYLQIVKADEYREMTNKSAIRSIPIEPPRGNIIDCNGNVLAESKQGYSLVFTETEESKKNFFSTMIKVFKILDENKEEQRDELELKINPYKFEFDTDNANTRRWMELRFKKDRGMDDAVRKKLFKDKKAEELTEEEKEKIDEELLKITPEETFNYMLDFYKINDEEKKLVYTDLFKKIKTSSKEQNFEYYLKEYKVKTKNKTEEKIFAELYKNMPEDVFNGLVKEYNIKTTRYSMELKRRFVLVKDAIKQQSYSGFKPIEIATNLKKECAFIFMQKYQELPGIEISVNPIRIYPNNDLGSSFLGYLSKINPSEQEKYEEKGYDVSSDYIGAAGIEGAFESTLRGSKGTKLVQINKYGRIMKELGRKEPYTGKTVQLTIDSELQYTAEQTLDKAMKDLQAQGISGDVDTTNATRGAAVVLEVKTGKVLALVSRPGYDPNLFAVPGRLTPELQSQYFNPDLKSFGREYCNNLLKRSSAAREAYKNKSIDEIVDILFPLDKSIKNNTSIRQDVYDIYPKPLYNYATKSLMPPGSTFKPLVGLAGLEEGVLGINETIYDGIVFTEHGYKGKDWNSYSFGKVDVAKAIEQSINYFFFEVGDRLFKTGKYNGGFDAIAHYAWKFGLGAPNGVKPATGIEIPEKFGQVYNLESGRRIFSALYMNSLLGFLQKGTDTRTANYKNHYIGVNIQEEENDTKEVKSVKEKLRNRILEEMKYKKKGTEDIKNYFVQLSNIDTDLKQKYKTAYDKYSSSYKGDTSKKISYEKYVLDQAEQAWMAAVYSIDDANYNINNQNNVYDASIGQGTNQFTPLQMVNYIATLVNGGNRYKVHLVDKILDQYGEVVKEYKPEVIEKIDLKKENVDAIKKGMSDVTSDGTAGKEMKDFPIHNGGKTGSATFARTQDLYGRTSAAVYVGFAPYDDPEIAVYAMVSDGGHGGYVAPVARAVYEKYFEERLKKEYTDYVPKYNYKLPSSENKEKTKSSADQKETNDSKTR